VARPPRKKGRFSRAQAAAAFLLAVALVALLFYLQMSR